MSKLHDMPLVVTSLADATGSYFGEDVFKYHSKLAIYLLTHFSPMLHFYAYLMKTRYRGYTNVTLD